METKEALDESENKRKELEELGGTVSPNRIIYMFISPIK